MSTKGTIKLISNIKNKNNSIDIIKQYHLLNDTKEETNVISNILIKKTPNSLKNNSTIQASNINSSQNSTNTAGNLDASIFQFHPERLPIAEKIKDITSKKDILGVVLDISIIRRIIEMDKAGRVISKETRKGFLPSNYGSLEDAKRVLAKMEELGYLDITHKRQKYHDYKPSAKAYEIWDFVKDNRLLISSTYHSINDQYVLPFEPNLLLGENETNLDNLKFNFKSFSYIPFSNNLVMAVGANSKGLDFVDFKGEAPSSFSFNTKDMQKLKGYLDLPDLGVHFKELISETNRHAATVEPEYIYNDSVYFKEPLSNKKFQVPTIVVKYIYNNYYGEPLELSVTPSEKFVSISYPNESSLYSYNKWKKEHLETFILQVYRQGAVNPLILARCEHNNDVLKLLK